jgi:predicted small secreted protein
MIRKILMVLGVAAVLAGCNTISGVGQDISAGGKAVEKAADNTQKKM